MNAAILMTVTVLLGTLADDPAKAPSPDLAAYRAAAARAGRDSGAHIQLALWCDAHGLASERVTQLALAVLYDPANALARALSGMVAYHGKWQRPEEIARINDANPRQKKLIEQYLDRRARTPYRVDAQLKLALWCEQNNLHQQATAHFHQIVKLDPSHELARMRMGFKKVGGHWFKPDALAQRKLADEEQHKADKRWQHALEKYRDELASKDKSRRASAQVGLVSVTDPRAVPAIWMTFGKGDPDLQKVAVTVLGQIDAPEASRALATLAIMSRSAEVRQIATQSLRRRDPREFAPLLISMMRDPIQFEVKNVNGPGSAGELLIKKNDANIRRVYSPLASPLVPLLPTDLVTNDANGLPLVFRDQGTYQFFETLSPTLARGTATMFGQGNAAGPKITSILQHAGVPAGASAPPVAGAAAALSGSARSAAGNGQGSGLEGCVIVGDVVLRGIEIPIGQMERDAENSAAVAQRQLTNDVQTIEAYNAPIVDANRAARLVLTDVIGSDLGPKRSAWEKWQANLFGYATSATRSTPEPPTYVEQVPVDYEPQAAPTIVNQVRRTVIRWEQSCFGAGTPVQTLAGQRSIEQLRTGDEVLTQDPRTGELKYQPTVAVFHNPPSATLRIELDQDSIVVTGIHRLWKVGRGWAMAREIAPGDHLRTLGGVQTVKSVRDESTQPVFNLQVANGQSFFAGKCAVLAHDNSLIEPTPSPFDAVRSSTLSPVP